MSAARRFASAAEACIGVPFRLHGRSRATGLDCVGLVVCALSDSGIAAVAPDRYALRNLAIDRHLPLVARNGFREAGGAILRGDLLLVTPGPAQHHLVVASGPNAFVHAHAGLRRVVRQTSLLVWPILHHWRLAGQE
ncbi:MAG: NlpC/P60 family protein [Erythrobacter sp.]|jgi:cell wall-associated NlpC family hydrolase